MVVYCEPILIGLNVTLQSLGRDAGSKTVFDDFLVRHLIFSGLLRPLPLAI